MSAPDIRPFVSMEDYQACVALQEETWGVGFSERVSPAILKVSQILGGVAAGAFDEDGSLTGFVFGMTGVRDGALVHWSDMLAVRADVRDTGLGATLKAYQREEVMRRGVEKMHWTFDPLQSRNAHLNFSKLGIVVREYAEDMYGEGDSPLFAGIGTDRFVALWLLGSERVRSRLDGRGSGASASAVVDGVPLALDADEGGAHPTPGEPTLTLEDERVGVKIPADIGSVMAEEMETARAWRSATRAALTHYLARGYEVRELVRGRPTSTYVLARDTG